MLAGILCATAVVLHVQSLLHKREALAWHLAELPSVTTQPTTSQGEADASTNQSQEVRTQLQAAWQPVFAALERCASPKIALLSIRSANLSSGLQIEGRSQHLDDVLDYVKALQSQDIFRSVLLVQNKRQEAEGDQGTPSIGFSIRMEVAK